MNSSCVSLLKVGFSSIQKLTFCQVTCTRSLATRAEVIQRRNELFNLENKRQRNKIGRIEKIDVHYVGLPEKAQLVMNKGISTPYECARHLGEMITNRSMVAVLNNGTLWHMHRPLPESCTLDFLNCMVQQPASVNKVFWRSCSFLLGATANIAFKDNINVQLHSFPSPNVRSGSFVYDVDLGLEDWKPTEDEMRVLSIEMVKLIQKNLPFEYLNVNVDLALEMFKDNPHKSAQIPDIAEHHDQEITLFRVGDHIDISRGPMISNTSQIGRCTLTAVHRLPSSNGLYRFQGVALPKDIIVNHFAYSVIEERARKLNSARLPGQDTFIEDQPPSNQITL